MFIANDSSVEFQQNVRRIGIAVIAIGGVRNRIEDLKSLVPRILEVLGTMKSGDVVTIKP